MSSVPKSANGSNSKGYRYACRSYWRMSSHRHGAGKCSGPNPIQQNITLLASWPEITNSWSAPKPVASSGSKLTVSNWISGWKLLGWCSHCHGNTQVNGWPILNPILITFDLASRWHHDGSHHSNQEAQTQKHSFKIMIVRSFEFKSQSPSNYW